MTTVLAPPVTVGQVLTRAADLIEEYGWCQGVFAMADGVECGVVDPRVDSFCVLGAVRRAASDLGFEFNHRFNSTDLLWDYADGACPAWNDRPQTTKADVVLALRNAAKAAA